MFILEICLDSTQLELLKADLTRTMPNVKSSHRCEAIARGLGYRTYASVLDATKVDAVSKVLVRGDIFTAYLADHGFPVSAKSFYAAAAKVALRDVSERFPTLTSWGIGVGRPRRTAEGRWETTQEMNAKFVRARMELTGDGYVRAFLASLAFLRLVIPTKTIRSGTGSYWLKHIAENYNCRYPEGEDLGPTYVPNGVLIAAASHAGFRIKTGVDDLGYDDVNVSFNMSVPALKDLDSEIRLTGPYAHRRQARRQR